MISRPTKLFLETLAALIVLTAVAAALLAVRLASGPISLNFLTPLLEDAINADGPVRVSVGDTVLTWGGWGRTLDVRVINATIRSTEGASIASIPETSISFSGRALARGILAPISLELIGPRISVTRLSDGRFDVSSATSEQDAAPAISLLLDALQRAPRADHAMSYLERVVVSGADIVLIDAAQNRVWHIPAADIAVFRQPDGLRSVATLAMSVAGTRVPVAMTARYAPASDRIEATLRAASVEAETIAALDPSLEDLKTLRMPLSADIRLEMRGSGRIERLEFLVAGENGSVAPSRYFPEAFRLDRLRLSGAVTDNLTAAAVESLHLDLGEAVVDAAGGLSGLGDRPVLTASGTVRGLEVDQLARVWPRGVAENPRRWISANLSGGSVREAEFRIDAASRDGSLAGLAADNVEVKFGFSGTDVRYFSPLPPVRGVRGTGLLTASRLDLKLTGGRLGSLQLGDSAVAVTGLETTDHRADIQVAVQGPLREALDLVDMRPLGYLRAIGLSPADFSGHASVRLRFRFPLIDRLKFDMVDVLAAGDITGFGQRNAALGRDVTGGALALRLTQDGMNITGRVALAGVPGDVDAARSFVSGATVVGETRVRARIDAAQRSALGLDLQPYVAGPVDVDLTYREFRAGRSEAAIAVGLAGAELSIPELAWKKQAGAPGRADVTLTLSQQKLREIAAFRVAAGDLSASGRATFADDGMALQRVDLHHVKAGLTDAAGLFERKGDGVTVAISGNSVDAGAVLRDRTPPGRERPPLRIHADVARVYLAADRYMDLVKIDGQRGRERWEGLNLQALVGGTGAARNLGISLRTERGRQVLNATSDDAGALLKVLDVTPNVVGGRLEVSAASEVGDDALAGTLRIRGFRVVRAPVLARVLSVALLTGILDSLRGDVIGFDILQSDFVFRDPQLEVRSARAHGSALGVTAAGSIDIAAEEVQLDGTIVPAYAVNSLLGNIPLIGDVLVGGRGGGIFAANYRVSGPLTDPQVSINPLSTLAPGFLRHLFSGGGTTADPGPDQPSQIQ